MYELDRYLAAMNELPEKVVEAEAELEKMEELFISRRNGHDDGGGYCEVGELFVRASGEKTGRTYTQNMEADPLELIEEAFENSALSASAGREQMNVGTGEKLCHSFDKAYYRTADDMKTFAKSIEKAFMSGEHQFEPLSIQVSRRVKYSGTINSKGLYVEDENLYYVVSVRAVAAHNGSASIAFDLSASRLEDITPEAVSGRARERVEKHLPLIKGKGGWHPCVLDGSAVCNILFTAWKMFSGQHYASGKSCMSGRLGETVAGGGLSITDCVICKESGYVFHYDCEGTAGQDVEIIKNGVFCGLMHNLESAAACQAVPTGNAGRKDTLSGVTQTDTLVTPKNLVVSSGEKTTEQLVAELSDGIYINQSFDEFHSFDFATGDYSIPCEGILIEAGHMTGRMENITIDGNIADLLNDITEAGCEMYSFPVSTMDSYTVHAPAIKLKKIKVSCDQK